MNAVVCVRVLGGDGGDGSGDEATESGAEFRVVADDEGHGGQIVIGNQPPLSSSYSNPHELPRPNPRCHQGRAPSPRRLTARGSFCLTPLLGSKAFTFGYVTREAADSVLPPASPSPSALSAPSTSASEPAPSATASTPEVESVDSHAADQLHEPALIMAAGTTHNDAEAHAEAHAGAHAEAHAEVVLEEVGRPIVDRVLAGGDQCVFFSGGGGRGGGGDGDDGGEIGGGGNDGSVGGGWLEGYLLREIFTHLVQSPTEPPTTSGESNPASTACMATVSCCQLVGESVVDLCGSGAGEKLRVRESAARGCFAQVRLRSKSVTCTQAVTAATTATTVAAAAMITTMTTPMTTIMTTTMATRACE